MFMTNCIIRRIRISTMALGLAVVFLTSITVQAATFNIADGNVAGLIAAINTANSSGVPNVINLAPGGTYTFTAPYDNVDFAALPRITGAITIEGNGSTIQRSSAAGTPDFRLFATLFADLTLHNLTVKGGRGGNGAGLNNNSGKLQIISSTVTENDSGDGGDGGGIFSICGTLTIVNSTISLNRSFGGYGGGGILNFSTNGCQATATITSSTIFENRADGPSGYQGRGDAIANAFSAAGSVVLKNSIFASPTQGLGTVCYPGVWASSGHNIAGDASCGLTGVGDMNSTNPFLGPAANNGGPTPTDAPQLNSPAIDAVPIAYCTDASGVPVTTDQRGVARPQGPACDIGSVEVVEALYHVCLGYDPTKAVKSGSTIPIKLQLCDGSGNDLSSSSITVSAVSITEVSTSISGPVQDSGDSNPDSNFRFDTTLGSTGGYIFNLKTTGLTTGTYNVNFTVTGDSLVYSAPFQVK